MFFIIWLIVKVICLTVKSLNVKKKQIYYKIKNNCFMVLPIYLN